MAGLKLGVFGGTFDPVHIGHLILAGEAQAQLHLDRLLFVLTPHPPHKTGQRISSMEMRLEMLRLALADNPSFEISRVDIDRPPPHYAVDTIRLIRAGFPAAEIVYLMGGDSLHDLPTWHQPVEFVAACDRIGVMCRPEYDVGLPALEQRLPGLSAKLQVFEAPLIEISSSEIRERVASSGHFRYFLPPALYDWIARHHPYRSPG